MSALGKAINRGATAGGRCLGFGLVGVTFFLYITVAALVHGGLCKATIALFDWVF